MGSGGSTQSDQKTTTQVLTPEQQSLVNYALPEYQKFAASNPTLPGSSAIAPFDPLQLQGQQQVLDAEGQIGKTIGNANAADQLLTSGALLDPTTNPALKATINAATEPIFSNLNQTTLPQIAADASTGAGGISANYGGSRQGIAEGLATQGAQRAAANAAAPIANAGYNSSLNALLSAIGQAPTTAAASTMPGTVTSTVGDVRQQQAQQGLSADAQASQLQQWLPYLKASLLTQGASGLPGGSTVSIGTSNKEPDTASKILGGASTAAGALGSILPFLMI